LYCVCVYQTHLRLKMQQYIFMCGAIVHCFSLVSCFTGKINRYYEYIWARYGGVNEAEVLGNLPKSLRAAVANHVLGPLLKKVPFFDCCSEPMEQVH